MSSIINTIRDCLPTLAAMPTIEFELDELYRYGLSAAEFDRRMRCGPDDPPLTLPSNIQAEYYRRFRPLERGYGEYRYEPCYARLETRIDGTPVRTVIWGWWFYYHPGTEAARACAVDVQPIARGMTRYLTRHRDVVRQMPRAVLRPIAD